jgi:hypothetical protein
MKRPRSKRKMDSFQGLVREPTVCDAFPPGLDLFCDQAAAERWTQQLKDTATVNRFSFEGLQQADGQPEKYLNDLLKISGKSYRKNSDAIKNMMVLLQGPLRIA